MQHGDAMDLADDAKSNSDDGAEANAGADALRSRFGWVGQPFRGADVAASIDQRSAAMKSLISVLATLAVAGFVPSSATAADLYGDEVQGAIIDDEIDDQQPVVVERERIIERRYYSRYVGRRRRGLSSAATSRPTIQNGTTGAHTISGEHFEWRTSRMARLWRPSPFRSLARRLDFGWARISLKKRGLLLDEEAGQSTPNIALNRASWLSSNDVERIPSRLTASLIASAFVFARRRPRAFAGAGLAEVDFLRTATTDPSR